MRRAVGILLNESVSTGLVKTTAGRSVLTASRQYASSANWAAATFPATNGLSAFQVVVSSTSSSVIPARGFAKAPARASESALEQPRKELLDVLKTRSEEVASFLEEGSEPVGLEQTGFKIESTKEDGAVTLVRVVEGYKVSVIFNPNDAFIPEEEGGPEGEREGEGEGQEGHENQGLQEEGGEGQEGEGEFDQGPFGAEPFLGFEVAIESSRQPNLRLSMELDIDVYGQVHVNNFGFKGEQKDNIGLTTEVASGLESFINKLGVDTDLVAYIWSHCRVHHDKAELERLTLLSQLLKK